MIRWRLARLFLVAFLLGLISLGVPARLPAAKSPPPAAPEAKETDGLTHLFKTLSALENGRLDQPVVILQLGDSHTANGVFSDRLRERFQERFGASGRGMLAPGVPFQWYRPGRVKVEQSKHWTSHNSFSNKTTGPFGLAGFRLSAKEAGAEMSLESLDEKGFCLVELEFLEQPKGGALTVFVDGKEAEKIETAGKTVQARRVAARTPPGSRRLKLAVKGDGPVDLLAWTIQRENPGIVYDSHGIVGATAEIIDRWDPKVVAWELARRDPALIVIQYGSNEGFHDDVDPVEYRKQFLDRVKALRKAVPKASILVVGPADGNRLPKYCASSARPWDKYPYQPLDDWEVRHYEELLKSKDGPLCRWHAPPKLALVREAQKQAAQAGDFAFWNWQEFMGGEGSVHQWALQDPALAAKDHVHLQSQGYIASADALFKAIMTEYDRYKKTVAKEPKNK